MKKIYFTPGPSQVYPKLERFMNEAFKKDILSISHRSQQFIEISQNTQDGLRKLLNIPPSHHIFFLSSSLESMERIIENTVKKYSFHFINGDFAKSFLHAAQAKNIKTSTYIFQPGECIDMKEVNIPNETEMICITQNETSNGSCIPMKSVYELKRRYPHIPIALDFVSSAPYPRVDFKLIDIAFFSVQKGFGLPSGLGVLIVNDILVQHSDIQGYHSYSSLAKKEKVFQTPETPNVLAIFLLGKVVEDMLKIGIARIRKLTEEKARLIEKCLQTYPHKGAPFIKNREVRSQTVFIVEFGKKAEEVVKRLASKGLIVGKGYREYKDTQIRIANFPQHSILHMQTLVNELGNILKEIRQ